MSALIGGLAVCIISWELLSLAIAWLRDGVDV